LARRLLSLANVAFRPGGPGPATAVDSFGDENQVRRNKIQAGRNESQAERNKIQAQRNKIQISYRFNSSAKSKVFQMIMAIGSFFCSAQ
jgi:hypothetical protein